MLPVAAFERDWGVLMPDASNLLRPSVLPASHQHWRPHLLPSGEGRESEDHQRRLDDRASEGLRAMMVSPMSTNLTDNATDQFDKILPNRELKQRDAAQTLKNIRTPMSATSPAFASCHAGNCHP
jgi:hypothetical protein